MCVVFLVFITKWGSTVVVGTKPDSNEDGLFAKEHGPPFGRLPNTRNKQKNPSVYNRNVHGSRGWQCIEHCNRLQRINDDERLT